MQIYQIYFHLYDVSMYRLLVSHKMPEISTQRDNFVTQFAQYHVHIVFCPEHVETIHDSPSGLW